MARHRPAAAAAVLAVALAGAACGGGADQGTQPAPDVTTFEQGGFDDLPLVPRSDPFGPRSETGGVVARTYRAVGVSPQGVIEFYRRVLPDAGWDPAEPAFRNDTATRQDWVTADRRLEVSASPVPDRRDPSAPQDAVQYSLVLRPRP